jgi:hypothetical protein
MRNVSTERNSLAHGDLKIGAKALGAEELNWTTGWPSGIAVSEN